MKEFAVKRKVKGIMYSPITSIILVILIVFFAKGTWSLYQKSADARIGREQVERQMEEISQRKDFLNKELSALSSEAGLEQEIRQKFNVKREGEDVAVIIKPKEGTPEAQTPITKWFHGFITQVVDFFQ